VGLPIGGAGRGGDAHASAGTHRISRLRLRVATACSRGPDRGWRRGGASRLGGGLRGLGVLLGQEGAVLAARLSSFGPLGAGHVVS
jgi:hypothetical protein